MNENQNPFEGIPGLADQEGLQNFQTQNQNPEQPNPNDQLQQLLNLQGGQQGVQPGVVEQPQVQPNPQVNPEVDALKAEIAALKQAVQQNQAQVHQPQTQAPATPQYTPEELQIAKNLLNQGYSRTDVINYLKMSKVGVNQDPNISRIEKLEQTMQQEAYNRSINEFETKMRNFGSPLGLSDTDLVHFANTAMEKLNINVATVTDLEPIFKALYPEQYNIRIARARQNPAASIITGAHVEQPQSFNNQNVDKYVDQFLRNKMPNQYANNLIQNKK